MLFRVKINSGNATRSTELMHVCGRWYNDQHFQKFQMICCTSPFRQLMQNNIVILVKTVFIQNHGQ